MSAPAETNDFDYICVGICRVNADSGVCLGCGRPPPPSPDTEPPVAAADASRYPVAGELVLDVPVGQQTA